MIAASAPAFEMHLGTREPVRYAGASGIREFFRDVARNWDSFRSEATDSATWAASLRGFLDQREALEVVGLRE